MAGRPWIHAELGEATFEELAGGLSGTALQSVLLEVMRRRARARAPRDVLRQFEHDAFTAPSPVDLRVSLAVDAELLAAAADFEAVELSPVAPLGACSTFAATDQNRVLSALRATEIVSDPTNVLALACALRLRASPGTPVDFATCQRVVRAQPVPKVKGFSQHFRIFVLATGGLEEKDHAFTARALVRHARTMLLALDRLEACGYAFGARRVDVLATPARAAVGDRIAAAIGAEAGTKTARKELTHPYYSAGLRIMLWVTAPDGAEIPLADGGAFDWLGTLTSNRRAVFVASGAGAQLIPLRFRRSARTDAPAS
jgi:hypothetical protein